MTDLAPTVGDPDAMRAMASALTGRADAIAGTTGKMSGDVGSALFEGPAADRIRVVVDGAKTKALGAVDLLREAAASLRADAIEVEKQNDALRAAAAAKAEADAEAAAAAAAAAETPPIADPATAAVPEGTAAPTDFAEAGAA